MPASVKTCWKNAPEVLGNLLASTQGVLESLWKSQRLWKPWTNTYRQLRHFGKSTDKSGGPLGPFSTVSPDAFIGCVKRKNPREKASSQYIVYKKSCWPNAHRVSADD
jgi:hypothetical protein